VTKEVATFAPSFLSFSRVRWWWGLKTPSSSKLQKKCLVFDGWSLPLPPTGLFICSLSRPFFPSAPSSLL
jgi:hypothetical protein